MNTRQMHLAESFAEKPRTLGRPPETKRRHRYPAGVTRLRVLTPAQNLRVKRAIQYLADTRFGGSLSAVARAIGRAQPSLSAIMDDVNQAGYETACRVVRMFGDDVPVAALLDSTGDVAELDGDAARCPALVSALARLEGILPERVVTELRRARLGGAASMTEEQWVDFAMQRKFAMAEGETLRGVDDHIREFNAARRPTP